MGRNLTHKQLDILVAISWPPYEGSPVTHLGRVLEIGERSARSQLDMVVNKLAGENPFHAVCIGVKERYLSLDNATLQESAGALMTSRFTPLLKLYPYGDVNTAAQDSGTTKGAFAQILWEAYAALGIRPTNQPQEFAHPLLALPICYMLQHASQYGRNGARGARGA